MLSLLLATSIALQAQTNPPPGRDPLSAVKFHIKSVESSDKERILRVKMTIKEDHYVMAKQPDGSELKIFGPRVEAKGKRPPELRVKVSPANAKLDFAGIETIDIHRGEMEIEIAFPNEPQKLPFDIVIRFHVETHTICYFPGRYVIPVPESNK